MKTIQRFFDGSKHFPGSILSRLNAGKAIVVLFIAVIAIAFSLSNPQPTSSAVVKNSEKGFLQEPGPSPTPACATIPQEDCVPNPNGEGSICCSIEQNGDRTCRLQSESCQTFDNPCDPENPVFVHVTTTLVTHSHTDAHGGRHFHTHLEIHGMTPMPGQCTDVGIGGPSRDSGGNRFAFVKTSTSQDTGAIISMVKDSSFNSSGPPPETFNDPLNIHIITRGNRPNFTAHLTLHMTENANGEMTACVSRENASCETPSQSQ